MSQENRLMFVEITKQVDYMSKEQYLNYLAVELLERMGISYPTQTEIDAVESLLESLFRKRKICGFQLITAYTRKNIDECTVL